jgi:DNA replication protein DnaC
MKFATMAKSLEKYEKNGTHRDYTSMEFISLLVEEEYSARINKKLQRTIGRANFKVGQACVENIKYSSARGLNKSDMEVFLTERWIKDARNLVITGPTGTGKTYLAEAIGLRACCLGFIVLKVRYQKLFDEIAFARGTGKYGKFLDKLSKVELLIIDDFGVSGIEVKQAVDLLDILEERDESGSMIITTQYPKMDWYGRFSDPTIADAICDRLIHSSYEINLKGDSLRGAK